MEGSGSSGAGLAKAGDLYKEAFNESQTALANAHQRVQAIVENEIAVLNEKVAKFEAEKQAWEATHKKLESVSGPRVDLNVGGKVFATSKSTLLAHRGSFFESAFSGRHEIQLDGRDGSYFIDRDPRVFHHVLNFMRGERLPISKLTIDEIDALERDADFFQLPELAALLPERRIGRTSNANTSVRVTRVTKTTAGGAWNANALGIRPLKAGSGIQRWAVKIIASANLHVMIGVVPSDADLESVNLFSRSGLFFYCHNGALYSGPPLSYSAKAYSSRVQVGQVVSVEFDTDARQISFSVDGIPRGVAYADVPVDKDLNFGVCLHDGGDCVETVNPPE